MRKRIDLNGKKFGRLTVISAAENDKNGNTRWNCVCDCGNKKIVKGQNLRNGTTKSCGCIRKEHGRKFFKQRNTTHGESRTKLYICWANMISRTKNKRNKSYKEYGGRGIEVCSEWEDFLKFKEWAMKNGYKEGLTLERTNNNSGYSPENCIWANWETQNNNKQQSRKIEYRGETRTVDQWAKEYGINRSTLVSRLNRGMTGEEALETPIKGGKGTGYKPHINKGKAQS